MAEYRLTVIGAGAVGKSALTVRFIQGNFVERYDPTIEDSYRKLIEIDNTACVLDIMDTAGQEIYSALRDQYMKTGEGFVLVYNVTSRLTFEAVDKLRTSVLRMKGDVEDFPVVLVGNKIDLPEREITPEEGKEKADKYKMPFIESSAKSNTNVNQIFLTLVRQINRWRAIHPEVKTGGKKPKKDKKPGEKKCQII